MAFPVNHYYVNVLKIYFCFCESPHDQIFANWNYLVLQVEPQKYSIYREEAVDTIVVALEASLTDDNVREKCCRALLILAGHFSFSGDVSIEKRILQPAEPLDSHHLSSIDNENRADGSISLVGMFDHLFSISPESPLVSDF